MKLNVTYFKVIPINIIFLLLFITQGFSQTNTYNCYLKNINQIDSKNLEFEIWLEWTGTNTQKLCFFQAGINFNYAGMANGGLITGAFQAGSADPSLPPVQQNFNVRPGINQTSKQFRILANIANPSSTAVPIPVPPGFRLGRFRITNSVDFTIASTPNFVWKFATGTSSTTQTRIGLYLNGSTDVTDVTIASQHFVESNPIIHSPCPEANAGGPYLSCGDVHLNGSIFNANVGTWSSSGTGTFDPGTTTLNATYHPSSVDLSIGSVSLNLTSDVGSCVSSASATFTYNDNNPCTIDGCDQLTGLATHTPADIDDDGNACTTDGCNSITGVFHTPVNTSDGNVCTSDACNSLTGTITHTAIATDDNNGCTTDGCDPITGVFHNYTVNVDDGNPCTIDACDPVGNITHTITNGDDGNACTIDACNSITGITHTPVNADDGNACTTDGCNSITGIFHTPVNPTDGNPCTTDACNSLNGSVTHTPVQINDNNACTIDGCGSVTGVVTHIAVPIDDGNPNTVDACDPATGIITHTLFTQLIFPAINLSAVYINAGTNIIISGQNFTQNSSAQIKIQSANGYLLNATSSVNVNGIFSYILSTTTLSPGTYSTTVTDNITNKSAVPKQFIITGSTNNNTQYLQVTEPVAGNSFATGSTIHIEWIDYMVSGANYPMVPNKSKRKYKYDIHYQTNGGTWNFFKTVSGSALLNTTISLSEFLTLNNVGNNILVRLTDDYVTSVQSTSGLFSVVTPVSSNNLQVNLDWDFSFPPLPSVVLGIAADGTARIYLHLNKTNPGIGPAITSVKVELSDGVNFDKTKLGKVALATVINSYSNEANSANSISITNNNRLNDYYFWYVAPDDFAGAGSSNDLTASSRNVTATFTVNFATGAPVTITKDIEIVRPPLMLVHGIGSDHTTWDSFAHNLSLFGVNLPVNFINDAAFKLTKTIDMYPFASFEANAFQITHGSTNISNSFQGVLTNMRMIGYAANRVDYVCHSMGGCVLRKVLDDYSNSFYVDSANQSYNNYRKGFVNKMITIDTPHRGTPFADLITQYLPFLFRPSISLDPIILIAAGFKGFFYFNGLIFTPTDAVLNFQVDQSNGGISFNATSNLKAHLIAGDVFDNSFTSLNSSVWNRYDEYPNNSTLLYRLYLAARHEEIDPVKKNALKNIQVNSSTNSDQEIAVKFLDLYMSWHNFDEFVLNSDEVVPLNSQIAGLGTSSSLVSIFNTPNTNLFHSDVKSVLNNTAIGDKVYDLLNTSISGNSSFGNIPATSNPIISANNSISKNNINSNASLISDTNKIKIISPTINSNITVDSTFIAWIHIKDTASLSLVNISFQGQNYFTSIIQPYVEFVIQATGDALEKNTLLVDAIYEYPDSVTDYYDTLSINVTTSQTCSQFIVRPEVMHLFKQETKTPSYQGIYNTFISDLSSSTQITATIDNPSIVRFDATGNFFIGLSDGETFATISYHGLFDTIYFNVEGDTSTSLASFSANATSVCKGTTVNYNNVSSGNPLGILWNFQGGNPSTSTSQNPAITYDTNGTFNVTLIATYLNKIDTLNLPNYITVNNCPIILNLKVFIQGFYHGNGTMVSTLTGYPTICDTITVELHSKDSIHELLYSVKGIIDTNGNGNFLFSSVIPDQYYIVIKHRNSIETWSALPVNFNSSTIIYDFSH